MQPSAVFLRNLRFTILIGSLVGVVNGQDILLGALPYGAVTPPQDIPANRKIVYQFSAVAGARVTAFAQEVLVTNGPNLCMLIKNPTGATVSSTSCTALPSIAKSVTVGTPGVYTVEVFGLVSNARSSATRVWTKISCDGETCPLPVSPLRLAATMQETRIPLNSPVEQTVNQAGLYHVYSFRANQGSAYTVTVVDLTNTTSTNPCLSLTGPTGLEIADPCSSTSTIRATVRPLKSGLHRVMIFENGFNAEMRYRLQLTCQGPCVEEEDRGVTIDPPSVRLSGVVGSSVRHDAEVRLTGKNGARSFALGAIRENWLSVSPSGGNLPAVLRVSADTRSLGAGTHKATIDVSTDVGFPSSFDVEFLVSAGSGPAGVQSDTEALYYEASGDAQFDKNNARIVSVRSTASSDQSLRASAKLGSGWVKVEPDVATVSPGQSVDLVVRVDPSVGPLAGILEDSLVLSVNGDVVKEIPIRLSFVGGAFGRPLFSATEKGITVFAALAPNPLRVVNISDTRRLVLVNPGPGDSNWAVSTDTPSLDVAPLFGSVLKPGDFQDLSLLTTPAIENSRPGELRPDNPHGNLLLRVSGDEQARKIPVYVWAIENVPPRISESGTILGVPGRQSARIRISHSEKEPRTYEISPPTWIDVLPRTGIIQPGRPEEFTVAIKDGFEVKPGDLATVVIRFPSLFGAGKDHVLNLDVVVGGAKQPETKSKLAEGCSVTSITAAFRNVGTFFEWRAGYPIDLEAQVVDNCGDVVKSGAASISFSNGEPSIALTVWPDGIWRGNWIPAKSSADPVRLRIAAVSSDSTTPRFTQASVSGYVR